MNKFNPYYVFIPCGNAGYTITAECVKVDNINVENNIKECNLALSPRFNTIEEKDTWMTPSNIKSVNDKLLSFVDDIRRTNPYELANTRLKLLSVPDPDFGGFSITDIDLDLLWMPKSPIPDEFLFKKMITIDTKKAYSSVCNLQENTSAKIINLDDYRK